MDLYEQTEGATLSGIAGDLGMARGTLAAWLTTFGSGTAGTDDDTLPGSPPAAARGRSPGGDAGPAGRSRRR